MAFYAQTVAGATVWSQEWLGSGLETLSKAVGQEFIIRVDRHKKR